MTFTSRLPGFFKRSLAARRATVLEGGLLDIAARVHLERGGAIDLDVADRLSENVIGIHALPLSVATNFVVNGRDVLVPMAIEEPSVVAAASNAARMVRSTGGFVGEASPPIMTAQIQLDAVPDPERASERILAVREEILRTGDAAVPRLVQRGGGCRGVDLRVLDAAEGVVVVHLHVEVGDAMGANICDTLAEVVAPIIHEALGGDMGLRILTNLNVRRLVRVRGEVTHEAMGGEEVSARVARASRFAELDPYRAVTHNKGLLNGVDAVALATGQDWRAIEAAAHGWAAHEGRYRPISTWKVSGERLVGHAEFPLAVGTVGGCVAVHPGVRAALELLGARSAGELAVLFAAVGLGQNLAALRALATEGIQAGHMRLHERREGER